jgi:hypothetical protein
LADVSQTSSAKHSVDDCVGNNVSVAVTIQAAMSWEVNSTNH